MSDAPQQPSYDELSADSVLAYVANLFARGEAREEPGDEAQAA